MFKFNSVPAYSFGKASKPDHKTEQPGPGAYDTEKVSQIIYKQNKTTAVIRPQSSRPQSKTIDIGPGQYEVNIPNNRVKGYYFTSSRKTDKGLRSGVPGPGQYDYENSLAHLKGKTSKIVFGKSDRLIDYSREKKGLPGPGQYEVERISPALERFKYNSGYKFPKSDKGEKWNKDALPGPGAYNSNIVTDLSHQTKGFSLGKSKNRPDSALTPVPGPGSYDLRDSKVNSGVKFGRNPRESLGKKDDIPGPGVYEIDLNSNAFKKTPGIKFGKEEKRFMPTDVPGPGNYEVPTKTFDQRGVKFPKDKKHQLKENAVPGPGNYDYNEFYKNNKGTFRFAKEPRNHQQRIDSPGPGAYNPQKTIPSPKISIPNAVRNKDMRNEVPGPGQYEVKVDNWNKNFPRFVKPDNKSKQNADPIGPGIYDIPHSIPDVPRYNYPTPGARKIAI